MNPVTDALLNNNHNIAKQLLDAGYDINEQDESGWTALMSACNWDDINDVKLLLQYNPDLNLKQYMGFTALDIAERKLDKSCYKYLILYKRIKGI
jgi:ankyrin repeat protein